jgi:hypothetical protein
MPKNTRRVTVNRTVTFQTTIDLPGYPEETDANMLVLLGGAAGNTGTLSLGELLAGSNLANNGTINRANWSVTGTSINVEPYITRPRNTALTVGTRVASLQPTAGNEAALGKLFVVTAINTGTNSGKTADSATEPTWATTDGGTTTDGGITYRTVPKFPTLSNYAQSTVYAVGTILRPSSTSMKEYLVVTQNLSAASTPTWASGTNDTVGSTVSFQTGGSVICIAGAKTYAFQTSFALGDVVKPSSASSEEYLVTVAGRSDVAALTASVGASVTRGTATFKRIV